MLRNPRRKFEKLSSRKPFFSKLYQTDPINFAFLFRLRHNENKGKQAEIRFEKRRVEYYWGYGLKTNKFAIIRHRYNDCHRKLRRTYRYYS